MKIELPDITKIVLTKLHVGVTQSVPQRVLEDLAAEHKDNVLRFATIDSWTDPILGQMFFALRSYLLKSEHSETQMLSVETPATWWDHLKHDWINSNSPIYRWLAHQLIVTPPRYRTESKMVETVVRVCPHNNTYLMESEDHFKFLMWEDKNNA